MCPLNISCISNSDFFIVLNEEEDSDDSEIEKIKDFFNDNYIHNGTLTMIITQFPKGDLKEEMKYLKYFVHVELLIKEDEFLAMKRSGKADGLKSLLLGSYLPRITSIARMEYYYNYTFYKGSLIKCTLFNKGKKEEAIARADKFFDYEQKWEIVYPTMTLIDVRWPGEHR